VKEISTQTSYTSLYNRRLTWSSSMDTNITRER